jgi:hypothetical protein
MPSAVIICAGGSQCKQKKQRELMTKESRKNLGDRNSYERQKDAIDLNIRKYHENITVRTEDDVMITLELVETD